ncbi:Casein kinase II regulatory subunit [Carpediemonas membranifera]|uniref:Casein kinase II subunit beta n=1 Tax=Carpediemonas membranifera TaxID=201153 RepID=A0A8J6DYU0_9EUKA|nr:Casein kinase II regulatory subunit [Carpediemonas membranifera]|eukprot:KAG9389813.1 Casein kinase II regulatory subunit [Carpediemonas membranifera]
MASSSVGYATFIDALCGLRGYQILARIPDEYLRDAFNLTGLSTEHPYFNESLKILLSRSHFDGSMTSEAAENAKLLYGMIHARYITTTHGLGRMREKYTKGIFGTCMRCSCAKTGLLPVGANDQPGVTSVKFFCPTCQDVYHPTVKAHTTIDGAFFGTTFPHLFMFQHTALHSAVNPRPYVPKIFGFAIYDEKWSKKRAAIARRRIRGEDPAEDLAKLPPRQAAMVPRLSGQRFVVFDGAIDE